jgi:outer membrane protein, multidrug efflux system
MTSRQRYFFSIYFLLTLFSLVLSGCMTGTRYQPPDTTSQMEDHWRNPSETGIILDPRQKPAAEWWKQFNDDTLTGLVGRLSGSNLALAEARERITEAYARRGIIRSDNSLQANASAAYTRAGAGDEALSTQPPRGTSVDMFSTGVAASWELDLWGRTKRLVAAADADIDADYADYRSMIVSISAELSLAYIDLRTFQARLESVYKNIALQEKTLSLAETRLKSGIGTKLEVVQTERLLKTTRSQVRELKRASDAAENRINVLLGARPGETVIHEGLLPEVPKLIGIGIPVDLMTRRPDILGAVHRYRAAVERTGAAEADKYPRLSISGTLSLQSDTPGGVVDPDSFVYSLGPGLSFPLLNGGRIDNNIRQYASRAEQARLALSQKLLLALSEVETAASGVVRTQERVMDLRDAEVSAQKSVELSESLFHAGLGDLFQVLDSEKQLVSIQDSLLLARQQALSEVITLYRALGGGWETVSPEGDMVKKDY